MALLRSPLFAMTLAGASLAVGCSDAAGADGQQVTQDVTSSEGANDGHEESADEPSAESGSAASATGAVSNVDAKDAPAMAAAPNTVSVTIDGQTLVVDDVVLWSNVGRPGDYDVFLEVHGPGVPSGSDIHVSATSLGTGCDKTTNFISFRPESDTQYMPSSTKDPSCGLDVDALPTDLGGRFTGSFAGTLRSIDTSTPETKRLAVTFDVVRAR